LLADATEVLGPELGVALALGLAVGDGDVVDGLAVGLADLVTVTDLVGVAAEVVLSLEDGWVTACCVFAGSVTTLLVGEELALFAGDVTEGVAEAVGDEVAVLLVIAAGGWLEVISMAMTTPPPNTAAVVAAATPRRPVSS
jgi:hypothetical protein